ncbi:MAG: hypothetical protein KDD02_20135, partial [Phaeodactylibacter sp.]|nr:hypothetical protein [Phaeodactylibacter sp.]
QDIQDPPDQQDIQDPPNTTVTFITASLPGSRDLCKKYYYQCASSNFYPFWAGYPPTKVNNSKAIYQPG